MVGLLVYKDESAQLRDSPQGRRIKMVDLL